jgi:hypothetical protein
MSIENPVMTGYDWEHQGFPLPTAKGSHPVR